MWKEKVVNFVKRVIGYKEIFPTPIVYDKKKVIALRFEKHTHDRFLQQYRLGGDVIKSHLKREAIHELVNTIVNQGLCEIEEREEHDRYIISGEIRIVKI